MSNYGFLVHLQRSSTVMMALALLTAIGASFNSFGSVGVKLRDTLITGRHETAKVRGSFGIDVSHQYA